MKPRKQIASSKFIWLKVALMVLGFLGVIWVMQWLQDPPEIDLGGQPIPAKVQFSGDNHDAAQGTAETVSN